MLDEGSEQEFKNNSVIYNYKWKARLKLEKEKEKICRSKIHSVLSTHSRCTRGQQRLWSR